MIYLSHFEFPSKEREYDFIFAQKRTCYDTYYPFLLSMRGAKIYDMDEEIVDVKKWTELANVRSYYEFFKRHEKEFEE